MKVKNKTYQLLYRNLCLVCIKIIFFVSRWIVKVKRILHLAGLSYIWLRQFDSNINRKWLLKKKKKEKTQCYCDMHAQEWNSLLGTSSKAILYRLFKVEHI